MRSLQEILDAARDLVRQGETGEAFPALLEALQGRPGYEAAIRTLQLIESNFNAVRQQQRKNLISNEEAQRAYSRASDDLLSLLDEIGSGRRPSPAAAAAPAPASGGIRPAWIWGGALGLALLLVVGFIWTRKNNAPQQTPTASDCAAFNASKEELKVLFVPFVNVGNTTANSPLSILLDQIEKVSKRQSLPLKAKIHPDAMPKDYTLSDLEDLGKRCNADVVIHGFYQQNPGDQSVKLRVRYKLLSGRTPAGGSVSAALNENLEVDETDFRAIEDIVFSLCARMAIQLDKPGPALIWFSKMKQKNAGEIGMEERLKKRPLIQKIRDK